MPVLTFLNTGVKTEFVESIDLIELDDAIMFGCKSGNCGTCAIRIVDGAENLSTRTPKESRLFELLGEADETIRLACQCRAFGDVTIFEIN
jgi:ferredoxin